MRALSVLLVLAALALLGWSVWGGGFDAMAAWAAQHQRAFQNDIALGLRGVRAGNAGAVWLLLGLCFAYGFFHAVGPGHGKVLIGGYGVGRDVPAVKLSVIALAASLGQAVTAVALVYAGIWLLALSRERLLGLAEGFFAAISYGAIGLIGLWLLVRGARHLLAVRAVQGEKPGHSHDESCGHRHGPNPDEIRQAQGLRDAAVLIAGIAVRPCTGALFVLIVTWQMGIALAGIAGAFAMALGTALVTILVGLGAVGLRGGVMLGLAASPAARVVLPLVEIAAGLGIAAFSGALLLRL